MSYKDELRLIEEVVYDISGIVQNLRAGAYSIFREGYRYMSDCEYLIEVGEGIVQLARKLKGRSKITNDVLPEIEDVYAAIENAIDMALIYDRVKFYLDERDAYYAINLLSSGYDYPDVLEAILPDEYINEFEGILSEKLERVRVRFFDEFPPIIADYFFGAFGHLMLAKELLMEYLSNEDKSLLDELIKAGEEIKRDGEAGIGVLNNIARSANEAIIEALEWLRSQLQALYEEYYYE